MGTMYMQNTKDKPAATNVYYKESVGGTLKCIQAGTGDVEEARTAVEDLLETTKTAYLKPVLSVVEGGKV